MKNNSLLQKLILTLIFLFGGSEFLVWAQAIDKKEVFERHQVVLNEVDTLNAFTVGNGRFAMTVDVTGLQTFSKHYQKGMSLGTMSDWGWHEFPNPEGYTLEAAMDTVEVGGKKIPYAVQSKESTRSKAINYVRQNPHRIHLAQLGWQLGNPSEKATTPEEIEQIHQVLNPWNGILQSRFVWKGEEVIVETFALQDQDAVVVEVKSDLIAQGRLGITLDFPFPTDTFLDEATHYRDQELNFIEQHTDQNQTGWSFKRRVDAFQYSTQLQSSLPLKIKEGLHGYTLSPQQSSACWQFVMHVSPTPSQLPPLTYADLKKESIQATTAFWERGAVLDFGHTSDPRAQELERRMVLSRYLTKVNCSGPNPPQETGLTLNSWYGRPHMEMHWWHVLPFALWGHSSVFTSQLEWYFRAYAGAKKIANRQGFEGVRWQKMTDPWGGETASSVGSFLVWQQPHIIYFSELLYQWFPASKTLAKYAPLVEETALFMQDFLNFDPTDQSYHLGPYLIPAQESYNPALTRDPTYELTYWKWGLETAQRWRERMGRPRHTTWDDRIHRLAPPAEQDSIYWATMTQANPYQNPEQLVDHPSVLGALAMVPKKDYINTAKMKATLHLIRERWQWESCWGWDFPLAAMAAQRLGEGALALEMLLYPAVKNTYLKNGHNYQTERLRLYLPGNGAFLIALARMALDQEGGGFPKEWQVKAEGFVEDL